MNFLSSSGCIVRGKYVILILLLFAGVAAGAAWWVNFQRAAKCREFWVEEATDLIRFAPRIEAFQLTEPAANAEFSFGGRGWIPTPIKDVSQRPGLLNARYSLLQDSSFEWPATPSSAMEAKWEYGIRFVNGARNATIIFAPEQRMLGHVQTGRMVVLKEKTVSGWSDYIARALADESATKVK